MGDKRPRRPEAGGWWPSRLIFKDYADPGFEDRERGPQAEERHQAYVQNAYATLAPTRELLWYGGWAGLQVGAAVLAFETALLLALIAAALSVDAISLANIYGATPLAGTFFEPLWPIVVSLPALPFFGAVGALAALARRRGNLRRRALDSYFNPVSPWLDQAAFWGLISGALIVGAYAGGMLGAQPDPTGVLTLALFAGALIAWITHRLWLLWYLPLIRRRGSASMDVIRGHIQRQI